MCSPDKKTPFRLELPDKKVCKQEPKIFYTKNEYQPGVKITDWQTALESDPIDTNPYCPGNLNYFLSHYKRLGNTPDEPLTTTTGSVLEQIFFKKQQDQVYQNLRKYMVNYFTYKDTLACETDLIDRRCPPLCAESYITTMQKSYPPPYPYPMKRFSFPTIPFLQNRKFRWEQDPALSDHMFYDEGYCQQVSQIQKIKGFRTKSYNPLLAINTDVTLPPERKKNALNWNFKENAHL